GAWFGIGASPGPLLIGAGMAARHHGAAPLLSLLLGVVLVAGMCWAQGQIGLVPPLGDGESLAQVAPRYYNQTTQRVLGGILGVAMIGWFGFNVGLGGAALSTLLGWPAAIGSLVLGLPVLALSVRGMAGWNRLAIVTTTCAVALVTLVVWRLAAHGLPVQLRAPGGVGGVLLDVASFVGYVAVFAFRAPDFSAGLRSRKDLAVCVLLLCVPMVGMTIAGAALERGTGTTDLVAALAQGGLALGNLLVAAAVIAPAFTTVYSGALGLSSAFRLQSRTATLLVAGGGVILAALRFDRYMGPWLSVLAATLPPFLVPMAAEAARRRRGGVRAAVPAWVWGPALAVALALFSRGQPVAPLVGLAVAGALTALWQGRNAREVRDRA
ncbi:MAG: purine-cytosine permease-like transporter, partial [Firmicutes bacterium]|nr:purine-cytosine permease-like transporter [Bacillota bacterium]